MNADSAAGTNRRSSLHGHWSSRAAFILAVTGSAVGLGNIWRFPYITGQNGGGAFVLVYLLCVFGVGLPIMMSEVMLGRRGRRNPIATMKILGEEEGSSDAWTLVGVLGVAAGLIILSFYSVIGGWCLAYIVRSFQGVFFEATPALAGSVFEDLTSSWLEVSVWHTVFMAMTVFVVGAGVQHGLERAVRFLMPALVLLLLVLIVYNFRLGAFQEAVHFLFAANFDALTPKSVLVALGQALFTLSIGMGAVMAYGAYLPEGTSITGTTLTVVLGDTAVALLAGLMIFPVLFAHHMNPASAGPGLIFETLPVAFGQLPAGGIFATLFFLLLTFAAWTSAIGLIEPAVAWIVETFYRSRVEASLLVGVIVWLLGLGTVLSFNLLSEFRFWQGTLYDNFEHLSSNIMLPLGGLLITVFAGWVMCRNSSSEELGVGTGALYKTWHFLARVVAPGAVIVILANATGII